MTKADDMRSLSKDARIKNTNVLIKQSLERIEKQAIAGYFDYTIEYEEVHDTNQLIGAFKDMDFATILLENSILVYWRANAND